MHQTSLTKIDDPSQRSSSHYRNYTAFIKEDNLTKSANKLPEPSSLQRFLSDTSKDKFDFSFNESKLLINKFKRFFEALHENQCQTQKEEEKVKIKWDKFQQALNNPFKFDDLIAEVRREQKNTEPRKQNAKNEKDKEEQRGRSLVEVRKREIIRKEYKSVEKCGSERKKERIGLWVKEIKSILNHGERFIKSDSLNS